MITACVSFCTFLHPTAISSILTIRSDHHDFCEPRVNLDLFLSARTILNYFQAHVVYRFLIGLYALTAIIQPCLCGTSPGSIVMIVPDGNTSSINQSNPSLNITYWVDDTNLPSEKGCIQSGYSICTYLVFSFC